MFSQEIFAASCVLQVPRVELGWLIFNILISLFPSDERAKCRDWIGTCIGGFTRDTPHGKRVEQNVLFSLRVYIICA